MKPFRTNRPKYYFVTMPNFAPALVTSTHDNDMQSDQERREYGNYFYNKNDAEDVARTVNRIFHDIRKQRKTQGQ